MASMIFQLEKVTIFPKISMWISTDFEKHYNPMSLACVEISDENYDKQPFNSSVYNIKWGYRLIM